MISRTIAILLLGILVTGCAVGRGVLDVRVPEAANPDTTALVKITEVTDRRVFELDPPMPSTPSLKDGEINDRAVTSRAVARKRGGYGNAMGDIVLPEGRTVAQLTREVLAKALRQAGYRVVAEGEPGYAGARPLGASIWQFWAWVTPGAFLVAVEHQALLELEGDWPLADRTREVRCYARVTSALGATTSLWEEAFQASLADLVANLEAALKRPAARISRSGGAPVD